MNIEEIRNNVRKAVQEYLESPEQWDDAMLAVDPANSEVRIIELEEAESLPDDIDEYDMMEFIEMTPDGKWQVDDDAIAAIE